MLNATKALTPADQPTALSELAYRIGGMDQAHKPAAFDGALNAITALPSCEQPALLNKLIDQILAMDHADQLQIYPTLFNVVEQLQSHQSVKERLHQQLDEAAGTLTAAEREAARGRQAG